MQNWKCFLTSKGVEATLALQEKGPLFAAVEGGDAVIVGALLRSWKLVHGEDEPFDEGEKAQLSPGANFLHLASQMGHLDVVKAFIQEGGYDPNMRSEGGVMPITLAAQYGHLNVLKYLIERGASYLAQVLQPACPCHVPPPE